MTKARLITWIDWDPDKTGIGADLPGSNTGLQVDINVEQGEEPVVITITDQAVTMTSKIEPELITISDPALLIHPETSVDENVAHVLRGLRDGSSMTRANSAFSDLLRHFGVAETRFAADNLDEFLESDNPSAWITNERKP